MKNRKFTKLFVLLILCTGYFFSFSFIGDKAFKHVFENNEGFGENTIIGTVDVSHLKDGEALSKLKNAQNNWINTTTINLQYKEKQIKLNGDSVIFLLAKSIDNAKSGEENMLYIDIKEEQIDSILKELNIAEETFNKSAFINEILTFPSMMEQGKYTVMLESFIMEIPENPAASEQSISAQNKAQSETVEVSALDTEIEKITDNEKKTDSADNITVVTNTETPKIKTKVTPSASAAPVTASTPSKKNTPSTTVEPSTAGSPTTSTATDTLTTPSTPTSTDTSSSQDTESTTDSTQNSTGKNTTQNLASSVIGDTIGFLIGVHNLINEQLISVLN